MLYLGQVVVNNLIQAEPISKNNLKENKFNNALIPDKEEQIHLSLSFLTTVTKTTTHDDDYYIIVLMGISRFSTYKPFFQIPETVHHWSRTQKYRRVSRKQLSGVTPA